MIYYTLFNKNNDRKTEHRKAHELLKYAVMNEYGLDTADMNISREKHGKPYFSDNTNICFSLSHSTGIAVCAVSENRIGADCELIHKHPQKVMKRCFSEEEALQVVNSAEPDVCFFRIWTLKEAYGKNTGSGISYPMRTISFDVSCPEDIKCSLVGFYFKQYKAGDYIISTCEVIKSEAAELVYADV